MYDRIILRYNWIVPRINHNETNDITNENDDDQWYDQNTGIFWVLMCITAVLAMIAVAGNSLVIFAVIKKRNVSAKFRYLNHAVLSLAIADFILSLFGTPFSVVYWYWGKSLMFHFPQSYISILSTRWNLLVFFLSYITVLCRSHKYWSIL